ncbi:tetratricopeptide repeat protein [Herbaspirillum frisingense]|uniref:Tetratricopeptide (TPR) repeat protein n=1 Tax=Herbaspirillum frisingense TaxID=92645 RepID=A0ABU1PFD7_9BURK|nr:tetratricopeptide repeat protein [Herbaspirillum frisingense]MDR6584053.1 tetratricopeptide (TPR) repeat protein [Herbaspirillum frisingense]
MNPHATLQLALDHFDLQDYAAAEQSLFALLEQHPQHKDALHLLGSVAAAQGRFEEAALAWQQALRLVEPDSEEALALRYRLGRAFYEQGRFEDAFLLYRDLIEAGHQQAEFFVAAAAALQAMSPSGKNDAQALPLLEEALQRNPEQADTWHRKALLHERAGQWEAARDCIHQALRLNDQSAQLWLAAGLIEHALGAYEEALRYYDQALILSPELVDAHVSRGTTLARLRDHEEAIDSYRRALRIDAGDADAHVNLALSLLALGRLEEALPLYEWRWEGRGADPYRHATIPAWNGGSSLQGKRLLLWAEQGQGDTIQFSRYVLQMVGAGAEVVLEVPASLLRLMQGLPCAASIRLVAMGQALPEVDFQLPLMSLPLVCNTSLASIPEGFPGASYLAPEAGLCSQWETRIAALAPRAAGRVRVGVVCSGNAGNVNDARRSIALERFATLEQARGGLDFFVLQPDLRDADAQWLRQAGPHWHELGADIGDFADTAAALSCMDLLISVDTAAAHLAGALGRPVWVALPHAPDWRWFLQRHDSPWYPTARLFRQQQAGAWDDVIRMLRAALAIEQFKA